ncbi:S41 family peptidase [Marinoscillum furvescens]|uniref:S41A family C-terminal processing peptidase-3 n=1 Tax=Marinoscillum furvescens DSM 4134 TaxID=1122208 RepID=A0A3D9KXQ9_MARFU|nr:S41 family peptidase [Marinoscillum furvescens]RED93594.1 S41A family C-terminal processing peptidase-3 [Marinoscillum furvescens DSM 4134]
MTRKWKAFLIAGSLGFGLLAFDQPLNDRTFEIVKNLDIFATLYKEVNSYYVDEINPSQLMRKGIGSMLSSLDPYTTYIPEDDIEDYRTITTGEYGGIGAVVDKKDGVSTIVLPYEGYPAHKAGLIAGDKIIKINGIALKGKSSDQISKLLKGQSNSELVLTIERYGKEAPFDVTLSRERITINNVPYSGMVTDNIGYLKLTDFTTEAGAEVKNAVNELKEDGAEKIILDLRGNPGGLLEEAVNVSNVFVGKGREVVTTRGKLKNWTKTYKTLNEAADEDIPLVVLVSNGSASASEIVSGVMQDYDRGVLVGQRTYGKGLVQQTRPLAYNSQLKVTTGKYYIPSGRCIQAIDYSHRNPDGSVGKIPDSLKSEFKTANGRSVYDGGGVNPDIEVETQELAPITISLLSNDLIFHFATRYFYEHPEIPDAKEFKLTDAEYQEFKQWLQDKDLNYTTQVERDIDKLIASSKKEQYYEDIAEQIEALREETLHNKDQDLVTFKPEIKKLLEREIAGRYYYQAGMVEAMFDQDKEVLAAIEVLNDTERYQQILKGE